MPVLWNICIMSDNFQVLVKLLLTEMDTWVVYSRSEAILTGKQPQMFQRSTVPPTLGSSSPRTFIYYHSSQFFIHATLQKSRHNRRLTVFRFILFNYEKTFISNIPALLLICHITETHVLQTIPKCVLTLYCNWKNVGVPFPLLSFKLAVTLKPWTFVALTNGANNKYL